MRILWLLIWQEFQPIINDDNGEIQKDYCEITSFNKKMERKQIQLSWKRIEGKIEHYT